MRICQYRIAFKQSVQSKRSRTGSAISNPQDADHELAAGSLLLCCLYPNDQITVTSHRKRSRARSSPSAEILPSRLSPRWSAGAWHSGGVRETSTRCLKTRQITMPGYCCIDNYRLLQYIASLATISIAADLGTAGNDGCFTGLMQNAER